MSFASCEIAQQLLLGIIGVTSSSATLQHKAASLLLAASHAHLAELLLQECRAFELLKGQADRVNYLVTKHAKVVAMTCTHAALKRRDFLKLGFRCAVCSHQQSWDGVEEPGAA